MKLPRHEHLYDLSLFAATVALAAWQDWSATDLVWSLWVSSLLVGYAFIIVTIFVGNDGGDDSGDLGQLSSVSGLALSLVTLCFFTFHFVGFHWGHGVYLNRFFPLVEPSTGLIGQGGPVWFGAVLGTAVQRYWPFLVATVLSRRSDFVRSVEADPDRDETQFQPYRNVVRMHLLIFVYAGLRAAELSGLFLYAVLLFYFSRWTR